MGKQERADCCSAELDSTTGSTEKHVSVWWVWLGVWHSVGCVSTSTLSAVSPCKLCAYSLSHRALHLAISHHYPLTETLEVLNLLAQLPPTDPPLLDILNRKGEVSVTAVLGI